MNTYENLLMEADKLGLITKEKPLLSSDGRIEGNKIAIRQDIDTSLEKACVLAEELGHHYTTVGNIIDVTDSYNAKQERQARLWAYNNQIGLCGLIRAYQAGKHSFHEAAEFLDVTEEVLKDCVAYYRDIYGICTTLDNYIIYFIPYLAVMERI